MHTSRFRIYILSYCLDQQKQLKNKIKISKFRTLRVGFHGTVNSLGQQLRVFARKEKYEKFKTCLFFSHTSSTNKISILSVIYFNPQFLTYKILIMNIKQLCKKYLLFSTGWILSLHDVPE